MDGLNWYTYVGNNPVNYVDPMGLAAVAARSYAEKRGATVNWTGNITIGGSAYANATVSFGGIDLKITGKLVDGNLMIDDSLLNSTFGWGQNLVAMSYTGLSSTNSYSIPIPAPVPPLDFFRLPDSVSDHIIQEGPRVVENLVDQWMNTPAFGANRYSGFDGFSANDIINFYDSFYGNIFKAAKGESSDENSKERSKFPPAPRIRHDSKKDAYQEAKRRGGGKEPIHHPQGEHGPHYHPDAKQPENWTPKVPTPHEHHYYPSGR